MGRQYRGSVLSDRDIIDTIAKTIDWALDYDDEGNPVHPYPPVLAETTLDALRSAGYAIVKLPKPDEGPDGEGEYSWTTPLGPANTCNGRVWDEDCDMDPEHAWEHAAALLAAADAPEADQ